MLFLPTEKPQATKPLSQMSYRKINSISERIIRQFWTIRSQKEDVDAMVEEEEEEREAARIEDPQRRLIYYWYGDVDEKELDEHLFKYCGYTLHGSDDTGLADWYVDHVGWKLREAEARIASLTKALEQEFNCVTSDYKTYSYPTRKGPKTIEIN